MQSKDRSKILLIVEIRKLGENKFLQKNKKITKKQKQKQKKTDATKSSDISTYIYKKLTKTLELP